MTNSCDVTRRMQPTERVVREGKEYTNASHEYVRRLHAEVTSLRGEEWYRRKLKELGDKEWARLLAMVDQGQHPSDCVHPRS